MMTRATPETIERRIAALRAHPSFIAAAAALGEALSTLKTWAKRNDALIRKHYPQYTYDGMLELTEGQLLQRRQSLRKASHARWSPERTREVKVRRPGRVKVIEPAPVPKEPVPPTWMPRTLGDLFDHIAAEVDKMIMYRDQASELRARNAELEADLARLKMELTEERAVRLRVEAKTLRVGPVDETGQGRERPLADILRS